MKKSIEQFRAYLDVLQQTLKYAEASRLLGLHPCTIFNWLKASKQAAAIERPDQPSEFKFEHAGETLWLHQHVRNTITISIEEIESAARSRALHGTKQVARFQGATVYRRDPSLIGRPDLVELLGVPDDLLRDPVTGLPEPEMIYHAPSTDLVMAVLQAHSKIYRRQSSVSVDLNARVSGGVMVMGGPKQAALPLPILEIIEVAEEEPTRTKQDVIEDIDSTAADDFGDDVVPEAIQSPEGTVSPPTTTARPVRQSTASNDAVEKQPPPMASGPNPAIHRGDSALVRDLLSRLKGPVATRSAPISTATNDFDDSDPDRCGPGETSGSKIA